MKILLTGKTGQVGYELEHSLQGLGEIIAVDRSQMDLANIEQIRQVISAVKPHLIINPAAYTAVDLAESEAQLAMQINGIAPEVMAEEAKKIGATMIHYSTDYVFDGSKRGANGDLIPYAEDDLPNPINAYGKTKLAGEQAIIASGCKHIIFRTSWVYSSHGKNFLLTMLRLAKERTHCDIVADQYGAPTSAQWIAQATAHFVKRTVVGYGVENANKAMGLSLDGICNLVCGGYTTWCGFAQEIITQAHKRGLLMAAIPTIQSISSAQYPVVAQRPINSRLSVQRLQEALAIAIPDWQVALASCLNAMTDPLIKEKF